MASKKRKKYNPHRRSAPNDENMYEEFMADLLDGTVKADKLVESRNPGNGKLDLDYDDPNG